MEYTVSKGKTILSGYYICPDCERNLTDDLWKAEGGVSIWLTKEAIETTLKNMSCPGCGQNRGNE